MYEKLEMVIDSCGSVVVFLMIIFALSISSAEEDFLKKGLDESEG